MTERIDLPQNEEEAREVIETLAKEIIVRNTSTENGRLRINATQASKEITDLLIQAWKSKK